MMDPVPTKKMPRARDERIILHFDLDCFYAQCVENRQPSLKALPLGIKQKSILATCNYVARRHGVKKLMLVSEARKLCPNLVIADGEDLSPFRDVSKRLYALLRSYSWNAKVERLGLDEIFLDVTDVVSYNVQLLNRNALQQSYFCLSPSDPEAGFAYDATSFSGCLYGLDPGPSDDHVLHMRLLVASHLAQHLRSKIEDEGYTTSCGIATSKLLAKLVGDKNKPRNQTTLLAPRQEDVLSFMDQHNLRKVPGIGFKTARALERFVLGQEPDRDVQRSTECAVTAGQVRTHPDVSPPTLERLLSGPGAEKGVGSKVWALLHGVDDTEVKPARDAPSQISIEDTYKGLNQPHEIHRELLAISSSLLRRMQIDLLDDDLSSNSTNNNPTNPLSSSSLPPRKWLAYPKTIRLTTRPYQPPAANKPYNWARASRSAPLPGFVFNPAVAPAQAAERLVAEVLLPLFHKLQPAIITTATSTSTTIITTNNQSQHQHQHQNENHQGGRRGDVGSSHSGGYNIGLLNVCVTNMAGADGGRRDIAAMFKRQEDVLREFRVHDDDDDGEDRGPRGDGNKQQRGEEDDEEGVEGVEGARAHLGLGIEMEMEVSPRRGGGGGGFRQARHDAEVEEVGEAEEEGYDDDRDSDTWTWGHDGGHEERGLDRCAICDRPVPRFAVAAHERYHRLGET